MLCKSISSRMSVCVCLVSLCTCNVVGFATNWVDDDDNDSRQQLRSASMGMTLIEVTQALYPATAAADWCVLYSLLPYFFLLRSSTNMATRPSPQQAPQTYQFKLVLLGKYNRMVASRHLFFFFFLAKVPDSWLFL